MPGEQQMEVLERFALGDLEAFEILFREFQGEVYRCTYESCEMLPPLRISPWKPFGVSIARVHDSIRHGVSKAGRGA